MRDEEKAFYLFIHPSSLIPHPCLSVIVRAGQFFLHPVGDQDHAFDG
jgi:hypothetical protein